MKLYILGDTKADKGAQLEKLTREILKSHGYRVVGTPERSLGGFDIDVRASKGVEKIICECKAHKNKIDTTDFLKFIGKVYVDNLKDSSTKGLIVALSGVNGHVQGIFNSIKKLDLNLINLIQGDDLVEWLVASHKIVNEEMLRYKVSITTDKYIKNTGLAYYESNVFWIVFFSDMTFTVLASDSVDDVSDNIIEYCKREILDYSFVDLKKELYVKSREMVLKRLIVEELLTNTYTSSEITDNVNNILANFTQTTNIAEIESLIGKISIIYLENGNYTMMLDSVEKWYEFYKAIIEVQNFITPIFENKKYLEHIDEKLFFFLLKDLGCFIKDNKPEIFDNCILAIRYSPLALQYLFSAEVQYIVNRPMPVCLKDDANKGGSQLITRKLVELLLLNMRIPEYSELYYTVYQVKTVENYNSLKIVIDENILFFEQNTKQALGKFNNVPGSPITFVEYINKE